MAAVSFLLITALFAVLIHSYRHCLWDGESRLTLAVVRKPDLIVSFEPKEPSLEILIIPENTVFETVHGYGDYQAGAIWRLGEIENRGPDFWVDSITESLALPVDAWAKEEGNRFNSFSGQNTEQFKSEMRNFFMDLLSGRGRTNLCAWDLVRLYWQTEKIKDYQIDVIDLGESSATKKTLLPDGSEVLEVDPAAGDRLVSKYFSRPDLREEDVSVGVYNGTAHSGLANRVARLVSNWGSRVLVVGDWQPSSEGCRYYSGPDAAKTKTAGAVETFLNCRFTGEVPGGEAVDLVVVVGEGYWQKLTQK